MRWSELVEKECVDVKGGEKLGHFSHADLRIDPETGRIEALLIPLHVSWFRKQSRQLELPWQKVKKVGAEMIIVDTAERAYGK
ncbi:YlmC/YmxH family sporulation protein [Staphylospora marina]|uniref:YlmC/YmxH family sporulation protein n=1 Tax=Staphylospora marina TaxID=2490858 RepID=UPI000F5BCA7B|nr:YlmC/YmxH family sporulation protein [Staphylospora marina]